MMPDVVLCDDYEKACGWFELMALLFKDIMIDANPATNTIHFKNGNSLVFIDRRYKSAYRLCETLEISDLDWYYDEINEKWGGSRGQY